MVLELAGRRKAGSVAVAGTGQARHLAKYAGYTLRKRTFVSQENIVGVEILMASGDDLQTAVLWPNIAKSEPSGNQRTRLNIPILRILMEVQVRPILRGFDNHYIAEKQCALTEQRLHCSNNVGIASQRTNCIVLLR